MSFFFFFSFIWWLLVFPVWIIMLLAFVNVVDQVWSVKVSGLLLPQNGTFSQVYARYLLFFISWFMAKCLQFNLLDCFLIFYFRLVFMVWSMYRSATPLAVQTSGVSAATCFLYFSKCATDQIVFCTVRFSPCGYYRRLIKGKLFMYWHAVSCCLFNHKHVYIHVVESSSVLHVRYRAVCLTGRR